MIATLSGNLQQKTIDRVVVDVGGVGYLVHVSMQTLAELPAEGAAVRLLCHTHVREDALQLFGFLQERERQAFELLKSVSGVGPKLAITILSGMPVDRLTNAIADGNHRLLTNIPGVGKKTAERLVVELKDRFSKLTVSGEGEPRARGAGELVEALVALGYKRPLAERAVRKVSGAENADEQPEQLLRRALATIQEL